MSLIKTWAPYFQSSVRVKGRAYQLAGRVTQLPPEEGELVRAQVRGSQIYLVTIGGDSPDVTARCTCPHFAGGTYCKHIWATLLDVQRNGLLSAKTPATVQVAADFNDAPPAPPKARRRDPGQKPQRAGEPEWVGRLSLLRSPPSMLDPGQFLPQPFVQQQVCYVIQAELSARFNHLVVELQQRQPTRSGWNRPKPLKVSLQHLHELADPVDREIAALLLGASALDIESGSIAGHDRGTSLFRIPSGAWRSMLRRMIATGRCYVEGQDELDIFDPGSESPAEDGAAAPARADGRITAWDDGQPWVLWAVGDVEGDELRLGVELRRGDERLAIHLPAVVLGGPDGLIICDGKAAAFDDREAPRWVQQFREESRSRGSSWSIRVPAEDVDRFVERLYLLPQLPELDLPPGVGRAEERVEPIPHLDLLSSASDPLLLGDVNRNMLIARVCFRYGSHHVKPGQPGRFVQAQDNARPHQDADPEAPVQDTLAADETDDAHLADKGPMIRRNRRREAEALASLVMLGFRPNAAGDAAGPGLLPVKLMPAAVSELLARGWSISADQKTLRQAGTPQLAISSGIDWFELRGGIKFQTSRGEQLVGLPEILAAAKASQNMVTLDDGSQGMLPADWLAAHGLLWSIGEVEDDHLRFKPTQAAVLDAMLSEQDLVEADARFQAARQRLREFSRIQPVEPAPSFCGSLRPYQREGLGWTAFLRWFGMGGILADDMGLGKTIQILAMLDGWYTHKSDQRNGQTPPADASTPAGDPSSDPDHQHYPSLIVVPRSVVFNWIDEAQRFTPNLRVQAYTGSERQTLRDAFADHDVIVTSYGLMRRDIAELAKHRFEYIVLDEAQAIKNPASQSAKAARLLAANHRLALTGTPVENHLGDLWSIFEFLNPGMLGVSSRFAELLRDAGDARRNGNGNGNGNGKPAAASGQVRLRGVGRDTAAAVQIGQVLRPLILRRTKGQVLRDLPEKTEQTILCQMEPAQRAVYDQLLAHYRGALLSQVESRGMGGSTMMVLEALLRLRQASCHPGLIDPARSDEPSAKLDVLLDRLADLIDEDHKSLVFSQFTSMLALVRKRLDERGIVYEYLDGQTRHRRQHVQRFQSDPQCKVFLISLKAGGLGLNLTAAEYVFILDPWWNPAVEAQAIDRAHRIGQTRPVFAYRLICQDTVEQRIAELQQQKKKLADAILGGQENLLRNLTREDLEKLLS